ncbi:20407_t:CDS:1, partial [Rhizophagus irregularis]
QVDGTDGKSMGLILMTPSVQLGGPSQSVWFDFGSKLDQPDR